jgi:hypothetical protein
MNEDEVRKIQWQVEGHVEIRKALSNASFRVSDIVSLLGISKRQLSYLEKHGMRFAEISSHERRWRKYSIMDVIWIAILMKLRKFGLKLNECGFVLTWFRKTIYQDFYFFHHFGLGYPMFLYINPDKQKVSYFGNTTSLGDLSDSISNDSPVILIPLWEILRDTFGHIKNNTFHVEYVESKKGDRQKAVFYIDGRPLEFEQHSGEIETEVEAW